MRSTKSLAALATAALAFGSLFCAVPVFADTVTVESRQTTTGTLTPDPPYKEVTGTWANSSAKSTAPGCTATGGSRFSDRLTTIPVIKITPTLGSPNAVYGIYVTMATAATSGSADLVVGVSATGGTLSVSGTTAFQKTSLNTWKLVGYITNTVANPAITFTYQSGTLTQSPSVRWFLDAVQFRNLADVCLQGYAQLSTVNGPLEAGQTSVEVPGLNAAANTVTVYADGQPIGTNTAPIITGGVTTVNTFALVKGQIIAATQHSNTVESCLSTTGPRVGGGNPRVRVALSIRQNTALTGPIGADGGTTGAKLTFLGSSGVVGGGFGNAPSGGRVVSPGSCWQTVSFLRGVDPTFAWTGSDGQPLSGDYGVLESIALAIDDLTDSGPYRIYIDNLRNGSTVIQDFESAAVGATEVLFKLPGTSGSTSPFLLSLAPGTTSPNISQVSDANADTGTKSAFISWQYKDLAAANWVRLVASGSGTPNPQLDLRQPISLRVLLLPVGELTGSSVSITTQPVSQNIFLGDGVSLTVAAEGSSPLTYQWQHNGVDIQDATDTTLNVFIDDYNKGGLYTAIVTGPSCVSTSQAAALGVLGTGNGLNAEYYSNQDRTFVNPPTLVRLDSQIDYDWITGSPDVSISSDTFTARWSGLVEPLFTENYTFHTTTDDGVRLWVNGVKIIDRWIDQAPTEVGSNIVLTANQQYSIVMEYYENLGGAAAKLAWSSAHQPKQIIPTSQLYTVEPAITVQPLTQSVNPGADVTLSVTATGSGLQYQWSGDGVPIIGANSNTFHLNPVHGSDAASYTVRLSNALGFVDSDPAVLSVSPEIIAQPATQSIANGGSVTFTVGATGTTPLSYQWKKGGVDIGGATSSSYAINPVSSGDAGSYTVNVSNSAGNVDSAAAILSVPPTIGTPPASQTVASGGNVTFTVVATGVNPLAYQWKKNGSTIGGANSDSYTINPVSGSDAGSYTVVVSDVAGSGESSAAVLSVTPTITTQPASQTVVARTAATLTVVADGQAPLAYQWSHGGTPIGGATSASYNIPSVHGTDAGDYTVQVSNAAGSPVTSSTATLSVSVAIVTQPVSRSAPPGSDVTFTVVADGEATLTYQWSKGPSEIGGATSSSYTLNNVHQAEAGSYSVRVSNGLGSVDSAAATLTISPEITSQPQNSTNCVGTAANFSVVANGVDPLSYQWYFNVTNSITDATNTSHSIPATALADAGNYTVVVTDINGSTTSAPPALLVVYPIPTASVNSATICAGGSVLLTATTSASNPTYLWSPGNETTASITVSPTTTTTYSVVVTENGCSSASASGTVTVNQLTTASGPASQTVNQGQPVTFTTAAGGTGPFTYTWRHAGTIVDGPGANSSYSIASAQASDGGAYTVEVQGVCNTVTNSATLTVIVPPQITQQPQSLTRTNGGSASFTVVASGSSPTYQWQFGGVNINGQTSATYTIASVSAGQAGSYTVVVSNAAGVVTSDPAVLTVLVPATVDTQPISLVRTQGSTATFSVVAAGDAPISYQWRFNGATISGANASSYTIAPVQLANAGNYQVVVANNSGSQTSQVATLTVQTARTAIFVDFNKEADFTNNFGGRQFNSGNAATWVETNTGGILNSRALGVGRSNNDGQSLTYLGESFDFTQIGAVLNIAVSVKAKTSTQTGLPSMQLGFLGDTNNYFTGDQPAVFMSARIGVQTSPQTWQMEQQTRTTAATAASHLTNGAVVTLGNWYRLKATFTKTAATTYTVSATLQDMGANGATPGAIMLALSNNPVVVTANNQITADSTVWPGMRYSDQRGIEAFDDFAAWGSSGAVILTQEPVDTSVEANRPVTFVAKVDGIGGYTNQWFRNGVAIAGSNLTTLTLTATTADNGAQFSFATTNSLGFAVSSNATLTVIGDTTAPTVVSAGSLNGTRIGVAFSEKVSSGTATVPGNYSVSSGTVGSVTLRPDGKSVELVMSSPASGAFTVTVSGVQDLAGNNVAGTVAASGNVAGMTPFDVNGPEGTPPLTAGASYTAKDGEFDVTAGGADLWNAADDGHLLVAPRTGDFDVRVRFQNIQRQIMTSITGSRDDFAKPTLTARASTAANAAAVQVALFPELTGLPSGRNFWEHSFRPTAGAGMAGIPGANNQGNAWTGGSLNYYTTPKATPINWGRLRRYNDNYTYYVSSNGVNWIQTATIFQSMGGTVQLGFGLTAHFDAVNYRVGTEFRDYSEISFPTAIISGVTINPTATNVQNFGTATFSVSASVANAPASELQYQWQRWDGVGGFTNVPGALATNVYTTPTLVESDSGSKWRAIVKVSGIAGVASPEVTVTMIDTIRPFISSIVNQGNPNAVAVNYSEPVDPTTSQDSANYTVTATGGGAMAIASAYLYTNGLSRIILSTVNPLTNGTYVLTAANVKDRFSIANTITNTTLTFVISNVPVGSIQRRFFSAITGVLPSDLYANAKFVNNLPDIVDYPSTIDQNADIGDNYGQQFRGYFVAPRTGTNIFYVSTDDGSELFLSTDENPANKVSIAKEEQWNNGRDWLQTARRTVNPATGFLFNRSGTNLNGANAAITATTVAGQKYYIEFNHKEGTGGDRATAYVVLPGDALPAAGAVPNIGPFLTPFGTLANIALTLQPTNRTALENSTVTLVAAATGLPTPSFKWQRNGIDIPGATSASYTTPLLTPADNGAQYRAIAWNSFSSATTTNATLTVNPDVTTPTIVFTTGDASLTNVTITFSELVTAASANLLGNYTIDGGALTILTATLQADNKTVVLSTSPQTQGVTYTARVSGVQDRAAVANTIAANSPAIWTGWVFCPGLVKVEYFTAIGGGTAVTDLTGSSKYIANTPDITFYTNLVSTAPAMDNYGTRVSGIFVAPASGNYTFYMRNDDGAQLFVSPDANPARRVIEINRTGVQSAYADGIGTSSSRAIALVAGGQYYFEALHKEGIGGDYVSLAVRVPGDATAAAGLQHMGASFLANWSNPDLITSTLTITEQPVDAGDVLENRTATFSVTALNTANLAQGYQWQKNGIDIPGAIGRTYTTPLLALSDSGAQWRVKVCIPGRLAISSAATVNVLPDEVGPNLVAGFGDPIPTHIRVVFDEIVSPATANNIENYLFSGGQTVNTAVLLADGKTVVLTVDFPFTTDLYFVQAMNIKDIASNGGNPLQNEFTPLFTAPWPCTNEVVLREVYLGNVGANDFNTMTNNPIFPNSPSQVDYLTNFNSTQTAPNVDNYSMRISGYLLPPVSGNYQFMIQSDDSGWLLISQDAGAENKKTVIRVEGGCAGCGGPQSTTPVNLTAGYAYYVEALMQEGIGGDYLTNFWKLPGSSTFSVIPGSNLVYCVNPDAVVLQIVQQPTPQTVQERRTATFQVVASATGPVNYQWQTFDNVLFLDWVDITDATNSTYRITPTDYSIQDGMMLRARISLAGVVPRTVTSDEVILTVLDDADGPTLVSASSLSGNTIKLVFDEDLDFNQATDTPSYSIDGGVNVTRADLLPNNSGVSNTVLLTLDGVVPADTFTGQAVSTDGGGNGTVVSISGKVFARGQGLFDNVIVGSLTDPIERGSTTVDINHLEVVAGGSDIWNNQDGFAYAYGSYTGDFDVRVRIPRLDARSRWSKAGVIVREDLAANGRNLSAVLTPAGALAADGSGIPANDYEAGYRSAAGAATTDWGNYVGARPTNSPPYENAWIRFRRLGDQFTAFYGSNGVNWIQYANTNLAFPSTLLVGLGTTAHNNGAGQITTAFYENYAKILPPTITVPPQNQTVAAGGTAVFSVGVSGEAPFTYQWRHDGTPLLGQNGSTLTISGVTPTDQGSYDVIVSNLVGNATSTAAQLVLGSAPPTTVSAFDFTGGTFHFSFQTVNGFNYLLQYKNTLDEPNWTTISTTPGDGTVKTIEDTPTPPIPPSRFYQIKIE